MSGRKVAEQTRRTQGIFHNLPRSRAMGYTPNELELFAFNRYGLAPLARDSAVISARADPIEAMRCYMAIFFSV